MQIIRLPVGMLQANCYLVAEAGGDAVVIDPGAEAERIIEAVRSRDLKVKHILLTHVHFDHMQAAADVAAATGRGYSGAGGGLARPDGSAAQPVPYDARRRAARPCPLRGSCGTERWWRQAS